MNSWSELNNEYNQAVITGGSEKSGYNHILQRKSQMINDLSTLTGRNTILYFSAFLNHGKNSINTDINDKDVNALMDVSCKSILMGRQSCIGPFDPQLGGVACQSMLREYEYAVKEVTNNPASLGLWQVMFSKLTPTFLTRCQQADELVDKLTDKILSGKGLSAAKVRNIKKKFAKNDDTKAHNRHIDREECRKVGLLIEDLESRQDIQDLVLGIHHCCGNYILATAIPPTNP